MSRRLISSAAVASALLIGGCGLTGPDFDQVGEIQFVDVEGGCWGLLSEGERYEPLDLPERFRVDGLRVRFRGNRVTDMASICQIGPLLRLESIDSIG